MHDIANYALDALKKAGADKASCSVGSNKKDELNVEANRFSLLRTVFGDSLHLYALVGGKKGTAVINKLDKASVDEAVTTCIDLAKSATPDDAEDISTLVENKHFDQSIGGANMDAMFTRTKEYLETVQEKYPKIITESIGTQFNKSDTIYLNSNGVEFTQSIEHYIFQSSFAAKDGEKASSFNYFGNSLDNLDTAFLDLGLNDQTLAESVKSLDTRMVEGKFVGPVIISPSCMDMILDSITSCFLDGFVMIQDTSVWKNSLGELVASPKFTFSRSPFDPSMVAGERITTDGFASQDFDVIKNGVLQSFMLTLYGSNKTGKPRALNTGYNLVVAPGEKSYQDMIKSIDRGILLNRFSGGSPGVSGDISGVAKNSFLIENGQITDAIQETMLSFNLQDLIKNVVAVSSERIATGYSLLPWCCFDGVTISGK